MKAIILNSGKGSRLKDFTMNYPKSLVKLDDNQTIFSRAIFILSNLGIDEFIITTGYLNNVLENYAKNIFPKINFTFVYNSVYDKTNYIKSIDLINDNLDEDLILLHGDLVFSQNVAKKVIESPLTSVIIDSSSQIPKYDFKAKIENNNVKYIGVDYFEDDAITCQPFYKFLSEDWRIWKNKIRDFCNDGIVNVYAENALNNLTDKISLNPLDIKGDLCQEVDTMEDLNKIKELI